MTLDKVSVRLGTPLPFGGSGGQWGANNSTSGVYAACVKLREAVAQKLGFSSAAMSHSPTARSSSAIARAAGAGRGRTGARSRGLDRIWRSRQDSPAIDLGAHFVEVGVDAATAEIRVRRMLAVCAAGGS